ncbi:hypothetical protein C8R43DRAFT_961888 [Mycena crocata]|nr:hypothetical protein C8R43DRAFT_961888 [Mycena crocata]
MQRQTVGRRSTSGRYPHPRLPGPPKFTNILIGSTNTAINASVPYHRRPNCQFFARKIQKSHELVSHSPEQCYGTAAKSGLRIGSTDSSAAQFTKWLYIRNVIVGQDPERLRGLISFELLRLQFELAIRVERRIRWHQKRAPFQTRLEAFWVTGGWMLLGRREIREVPEKAYCAITAAGAGSGAVRLIKAISIRQQLQDKSMVITWPSGLQLQVGFDLFS